MNTPLSIGRVAGIVDSYAQQAKPDSGERTKRKRQKSKQTPQESSADHAEHKVGDKDLGVHLDREV
jgi:hypothetical protein